MVNHSIEVNRKSDKKKKIDWTYKGQSISFRTEFFALLRSVVTTPATSDVIPKVLWSSVLKASFLCASCVTEL
jgi:hypothetical protein